MSKQNISKGNPAAQSSGATKGAPNKAGSKPAAPPPPAKKNGSASKPTSGTYASSPRPGAARPAARNATGRAVPAPAKRRGFRLFRLRPLDIGLILAGLIVVGFIVLSALHAPVVAIDPNAQLTGSGTPIPVGKAAPDFTLPGLDGQTYTLSSFKGQPVVLEFMATWCPHCQAEASIMNQIEAAYKPKGVQVLAVNATQYDHNAEGASTKGLATMDDLKWFHDNFNVTYPMLFDKSLKSANDYQVVGYPTIYIVDKNGNIAVQPSDSNPEPDYATLSTAIDKVLAAN
jgi:peroxiredoxin